MPGTTSRLATRYPVGNDPVNVAGDMQNLATDLDNSVGLLMDPSVLGLQAGVLDGGTLTVLSTTSVRISAGRAWVPLDRNSGSRVHRLVSWAQTDITGIPVSSDANPRLDQIVVNATGVISRQAGAATAGATLDNRSGAPALATNALLLHDLLSRTTAVAAAYIRDRRPLAGGAAASVYDESGDFTYSGGQAVTELVRVELSGAAVALMVAAEMKGLSAPTYEVQVGWYVVSGPAGVAAGVIDKARVRNLVSVQNAVFPHRTAETFWTPPAAGSYLLAIYGIGVGANGNTFYRNPYKPIFGTLEELVGRGGNNGSV